VCRGTLEERIDALVESKRSLTREVIGADGAAMLTELDDRELLSVVRLDLTSALDGDGPRTARGVDHGAD
ncbi:MAG: hypothetical protein ACRDH5_10305, partial [bacterium]